jgi:predicted cobalt transporter CbtA
VPDALAHRFATVVIVTSFVFWAALGVLGALFFNRFRRPPAAWAPGSRPSGARPRSSLR